MRVLFLIGLLFSGLASCQTIGNWGTHDHPKLKVMDLRVTSATDEGSAVEIACLVENPNPFKLGIEHVAYELWVDGHGKYVGDAVPRVTAPRRGGQLLILKAGIAGQSLAGKKYHFWARITYRPQGEIRTLMTESNLPLPWKEISVKGKFK